MKGIQGVQRDFRGSEQLTGFEEMLGGDGNAAVRAFGHVSSEEVENLFSLAFIDLSQASFPRYQGSEFDLAQKADDGRSDCSQRIFGGGAQGFGTVVGAEDAGVDIGAVSGHCALRAATAPPGFLPSRRCGIRSARAGASWSSVRQRVSPPACLGG